MDILHYIYQIILSNVTISRVHYRISWILLKINHGFTTAFAVKP